MGKGGVAFGDRLEGSLVDKWREHYINYAHLRKIVEKLEANIDQAKKAGAAQAANVNPTHTWWHSLRAGGGALNNLGPGIDIF